MVNLNPLLLRRLLPFLTIAIIAISLEAFLLRNIGNWDYPLSGEYLTSPFHSEILKRSLNIWDEYFGLGFSNLLNSQGAAQYAAAYSGAMWVSGNVLNTLFQQIGPAYFINQSASLFLLIIGIYLILANFRSASRSVGMVVLLSVALAIIIHSTDFIINMVGLGGKFPAGLGLLLITFNQYRRLSRFGFQRIYPVSNLIPLVLSLASLLLIANPYFLALVLLIGIQWVVGYLGGDGNKNKIFIHYAKILTASILLMFLVYGYVIAPVLFSTANALMSGVVGRHDSPMQYLLIDLLRFFNKPTSDHLGGAGTWMQFGLAFLGITLALSSHKMRRWARVDLICIVVFLFLAKGSAPPFPEVNHWIHANIPFMRLMGSGYPYFGVIYVLFIYYLIYGVGRVFAVAKKLLPRAGIYIAWLVIIAAVILAIFRNDAYLSGDFGGRVQSIEYPSEYYAFKKIAEKDMQLGRAYYFPDANARTGMDYKYSPIHSNRPMDCCYDLPFSSVFPIGIHWSNFEKFSGFYGQTMDYLMKHLDDGDELAEILSRVDTRYVVFDLSLKKTATANSRMVALRDQVLTSEFFQFQPTLSNRYVEVYENKKWHSALTETKNITLATDDPNVFMRAARSGPESSRDNTVVSGAVTLDQAAKLKGDNLLKKVVLYNSDEMGLMLDLIHSKYELKPDANSLNSDGNLGWFTYNQVYQILDKVGYGGRFIGRYSLASMANGVAANYFPSILPDVKNRLFIRAMVSPDSGRLWVYVHGEKRPLNLHSSGYIGLQWFDLGEVVEASGKVKLTVEAQDAGYLKRIDVVSIIPSENIAKSSELMRDLLAEMSIERVEKPDYLQWKTVKQLAGDNPALHQKDMQITPKRLMISRHDFSLHEDFDRFDGAPGQEAYNVINQPDEKIATLDGLFQDKNFIRDYGGYNPRFNASADSGAGTYSLRYELFACQAFADLTLDLHTAFVTVGRPIHIYVSEDAYSWISFATLTSDDQKILDLSDFAKGKKKVYLKISYEKPQEGPISILLTDLRINGTAGNENMTCKSLPTRGREINSIVVMPHQRIGFNHPPRTHVYPAQIGSGIPTRNETVAVPGIALINKAYDPNWRMGDQSPINIDYGFAAFPIADTSKIPTFHHSWRHKYKALFYASAVSYLLLWIALVFFGYRRKYRVCIST